MYIINARDCSKLMVQLPRDDLELHQPFHHLSPSSPNLLNCHGLVLQTRQISIYSVHDTMLEGTRRWFRRNRARFAIGLSALGAVYLAGQYAWNKWLEVQQRVSEERIAKEK